MPSSKMFPHQPPRSHRRGRDFEKVHTDEMRASRMAALSGKISSGGMSDVYAGIDSESGKRIALKLAAPNNIPLELANRYIGRESAALQKLRHPNIVSYLGSGQAGGRNYLLLEFVDGESIDDRLSKGPFTWPEAKRVLNGLCDALSAAHASGVVHADLTASNVALARSNSGGLRPVLLDFGFVKFLDNNLNHDRTPNRDTVLGTYSYLAPEQAFSFVAPDFDHRADIYSFGVLAYRILSGRYPFKAPTPYTLLMKHLEEPPIPLTGIPGLPSEANTIVLKALAKRPDERHQSAEELKAELEKAPDS
ncbi:MAG: serine/threonine-protein kinase [Candidatus Micrarchaeota archaeon]